jgi:uncharacterized protein DUF5672
VPPSAAIAVPTQSLKLDPHELVSFGRLRAVLGSYDTYLVLPDDEAGTLDGLPVKRFASRYFRGPKRLNQRLVMSADFYGAFAGYDYVLIYHLDSLALSDELGAWCEAGWDNIGAPWSRRAPDGRLVLTGVGNGGFALRRVESCLRVATLAKRPRSRAGTLAWFGAAVGRRFFTHLPRTVRTVATSSRKARTVAGVVRGALATTFVTEDKFWSELAPRLDPTFRVAPPEVALSFAFDANPRECFELAGGRLPFGCHKWWFHDPEFWEPYLSEIDAAARNIAT